MTIAYLNRIGTAVPDYDVHQTFIDFVDRTLEDQRTKRIFQRMVQRAGIEHRYSSLEPGERMDLSADKDGFYRRGEFPGTGARMARFESAALDLATRAVGCLNPEDNGSSITHLVLASCTGFTAPGIDQQLVEALGLDPSVERTALGFMGCAAAVNALKIAHHVVRSTPDAKILVVNIELCTLHMQETRDLEQILSALLFGDGCSAALVSSDPVGLALTDFKALANTIPDTRETHHLGGWRSGFQHDPVGEVPTQITRALEHEASRNDGGIFRGTRPEEIDLWAVHAGGRTILDAVEQGLGLDQHALHWSRGVLREFGNMSSATLMFVLDRMMRAVKERLRALDGVLALVRGGDFRFRTVG